MKNLTTLIVTAFGCFPVVETCLSQPYIDIANIHYVNSPDQGIINQNKNATRLKQFAIGTTLPFQFKNKTDVIILSPALEIWSPEIETTNKDFEKQYGLALPVSFLKTLTNP